jgi:hypothetical protein
MIGHTGQHKDSSVPSYNHHGDAKSVDKKPRILISVIIALSSFEEGRNGTPVSEECNNGND